MKETLMISLLLLLFCCAGPEAEQATQVAEEVVETVTDTSPFDLDYIRGHFDPAKHPDFTLIDVQYADREGLYLRKDSYAAFLKMYEAALADGVKLVIRSATRNFEYQKGIWERKWTGKTKLEGDVAAPEAYPNPKDRALAILRYSSMPGTSRHHWGTDIDFNSFNNEYFEQGEGKKIYDWLAAHAATYGFCQTYTPKGDARPNGYNEERWHWSYLPVANQLTALAQKELKDQMIQGFKGAETATEIRVVENYVLGINKACQP